MTAAHRIKRLARPRAQLKPEYTAVVVGSGYGAGVAASRLARAGQSVCVLERGREIVPGEYPDDLAAAQAEMQIDTGRGRIGSCTGMFNLHLNADMMALVGCGLGGTSLINANVALEMDPRQFDQLPWPEEFKADKAALAEYAELARKMLDANPYPQSFPTLNKLEALESSAKAMQQPFYRPPIAVNFEDQVNPFGVAQPRCTLCGDCTSGCNDGAKNTTLMNYLPDACNHGAEIFTHARVSHIERDGDGWRVHLNDKSERPLSVKARIVVLGAGSLGSTEILLRSKARGLALSDTLGARFSGNGDVLAFGYNNHWRRESDAKGAAPRYKSLNGIGRGANKLKPQQRPGPCITGVIDMRGAPQVADGLVIEEGVIPGALAAAIPAGAFMADALYGNFLQYGTEDAKSRLLEAQAEGNAIMNDPGKMVQMAYAGPAARTQTYLVMSVDDAKGEMRLEDDRLRIAWPGAGRSPAIERVNELLKQATEAIRGHFIPNPLWTEPQGYKLVTVHPLGGCAMGQDAGQGVVNHKCQVFDPSHAGAVHPGLYVCDGAVLPGAVGVNPLLTICAVAERACALMARDYGWSIDHANAQPKPLNNLRAREVHEKKRGALGSIVQALKRGAIAIAKWLLRAIIARYPALLSPSLQFTERMHGDASTRAPRGDSNPSKRIGTDFELATAWGRAEDQRLSFELTIRADNLHRLTSDPAHSATITGSVCCPALSKDPMPVLRGDFHLLPIDPERVETWRMTYDMVLDRDGAKVHFHGFKVLHEAPGSHWWDDVTTLFVTVRDGEDGRGDLLAQGILRLDLEDLLWQASSGKVEGAHGLLANLVNRIAAARDAIQMLYLGRFAGFFGGALFQAYGGMLADMKNFPRDAQRVRRPLRAPQPTIHSIGLETGYKIRLTRYAGGSKGPVILAPGFTVKASSFAIDTVEENLVEYLTARNYDVWLFDYRASPDSGSPIGAFTLDDIVKIDWPAAVEFVRRTSGAADVQVIAHCVGSMSLLMALLNGMEGVRSVISSALTLHPVTNWLSYLKVDLDLVRVMDEMDDFKNGFNVVPVAPDSAPKTLELDRKIDVLAWNVPVPDGEQCKNPVCHRVFSIFGPSYAHAQLDHATHNAMMEMFGPIAIPPFAQLSRIMERGKVVDKDGHDSYLTPENARRLALPITFVTGALNQIFDPETVARTYRWVVEHNGATHYAQHLFERYAHMDLFIGRDAATDVYPFLADWLERQGRMA